jgi:hypothetical protein
LDYNRTTLSGIVRRRHGDDMDKCDIAGKTMAMHDQRARPLGCFK